MNENEIVERIVALHPEATIEVAGEDCSFEVYVVSDGFKGMNTLQRQKPILALFQPELASGKLHALSVKAKTAEELAANSSLIQLSL